jgi:Caspase domain
MASNREMSGNRFALLIGVSKYGEGFQPLLGSLLDIAEMKKVLSDPDCGNFQVEILPDPGLLHMRSSIEKFFRDRSPNDLLLLYFSGHGDIGNIIHQPKLVSPQYFGVGNYPGYHDQPKGLPEDFSRIIVAREGIFPILEIRSRTYSKKLISNFRVVATRDIKVSQALVPRVV